MKPDPQDQPMLVPQEVREILDQIRSDHELIERLRITPEELETLSKCAMFGTLTCKQDMLFILRQIREAGGGSAIGQTSLFPQPAPPAEQEEDPTPPGPPPHLGSSRRHGRARAGFAGGCCSSPRARAVRHSSLDDRPGRGDGVEFPDRDVALA